jgi:hypothetical protein
MPNTPYDDQINEVEQKLNNAFGPATHQFATLMVLIANYGAGDAGAGAILNRIMQEPENQFAALKEVFPTLTYRPYFPIPSQLLRVLSLKTDYEVVNQVLQELQRYAAQG